MNAMLGKSSANQFYFPNQLLSLINFITTIHINIIKSDISKVHIKGNERI
jgi:hypothetical protein